MVNATIKMSVGQNGHKRATSEEEEHYQDLKLGVPAENASVEPVPNMLSSHSTYIEADRKGPVGQQKATVLCNRATSFGPSYA